MTPTVPERPAVLRWLYVFNAFAALAFLTVAGVGAALLMHRHDYVEDGVEPERLLMAGLLLIAVGLPFGTAHLAAFALPRTAWAWAVWLTVLLGGLWCFPVALPLLIVWCGPRVRAYFGVSEEAGGGSNVTV